MLSVDDLRVRYGGVVAVRAATFAIQAGRLTALVGPNGAGKTSTLAAIAGVVPSEGTIGLGGFPLERLPAHRRAAAGLAYVPDGRRLFGRLSVEQNLIVGSAPVARGTARDAIARVLDRFPILQERRHQRADTLSGGEGQSLMIARALVARPKALLVDEPFQGLSAEATELVLRALREAASDGTAVLIASPEPLVGIDSVRIHHGSTVEVVS